MSQTEARTTRCERASIHPGRRGRRGWRLVALAVLLPMTMGGEFTACLLATTVLQVATATQRLSGSETFTTCGECSDFSGGRDYFDVPTAPEHAFVATFKIQPLDGALATTDARCFLRLKRCGALTSSLTYEATLVEDGLGLRGEVCMTGDACIDSASGQRQAAYWEVIIQRTGSEGIKVDWDVSYVEYRDSAQPMRPGDLTCP